MKLLAVGDSFTCGDELTDPSRAWPAILSQKLNYDLINLGSGGACNTKILRNAVEHIGDCDIVIAAWSHFDRTEVADQEGVYDIWPGRVNVPMVDKFPWRKQIVDYVSRYHCDQYLYKQYVVNMILFQSLACSYNKRYIMLDAFGNNIELRKKFSNLVGKIDTRYFVGWPNETMMEWAGTSPKGPRGHFLEEGHQRVADKIYEHIRNLGWLS